MLISVGSERPARNDRWFGAVGTVGTVGSKRVTGGAVHASTRGYVLTSQRSARAFACFEAAVLRLLDVLAVATAHGGECGVPRGEIADGGKEREVREN